ncbi:putative acetyltransferase [Dysgonomonadaceae bacterium PH5-43]|nr:putative acetyltransferase [Dysgonomonadaceae bacterium PH5-43]
MITLSSNKYIEQLKSLWKLSFPDDSDAFINFYFDNVYEDDETVVVIKDDKVVSSLQIIPYPIKIGANINLAGYISGAMTHPDYRKQGLMRELLYAAFDIMKDKGYTHSFLIPQEEWLFDYYREFGYEKAFPINQSIVVDEPKMSTIYPNILRDRTIKVCASINEVDIDDFYMVYYRFLLEKDNAVLKNKQHIKNILGDLFNAGGALFYNDWGVAFTCVDNNSADICELFFHDDEIKNDFLCSIYQYYPQREIIYYNNPNAPFLKYKGMLKSLSGDTAETSIYMSMMLD